MSGKWTKVGQVYVDGGYIVIGDPWNFPKSGEWSTRLGSLLDEAKSGQIKGETGLVAVSTGLGDGAYEVEVRYQEVPGWGKRVAEMRIVFLTDEMLGIGEALLAKGESK